MKSTKFVLTAIATGALLLGSSGVALARGWDSCSDRIRKDQRDVDRAIDRYGYNSGKAEHERRELERDEAKCGYGNYDSRRYRDRDAWRYGRGYGDYEAARDNGYRDGLLMGERDAERNRAFRPDKNDWYEDADRGYDKAYGDKNSYKNEYRESFEQGYAEGYRRWR